MVGTSNQSVPVAWLALKMQRLFLLSAVATEMTRRLSLFSPVWSDDMDALALCLDWAHFQWIGLRENLQETIDFPIKYGGFL